jgi:hypothetical protein
MNDESKSKNPTQQYPLTSLPASVAELKVNYDKLQELGQVAKFFSDLGVEIVTLPTGEIIMQKDDAISEKWWFQQKEKEKKDEGKGEKGGKRRNNLKPPTLNIPKYHSSSRGILMSPTLSPQSTPSTPMTPLTYLSTNVDNNNNNVNGGQTSPTIIFQDY